MAEELGLAGARDFSLLKNQTTSGAYFATFPVETGTISAEVKRAECESDHSPPI
jgi:hypothetical protein